MDHLETKNSIKKSIFETKLLQNRPLCKYFAEFLPAGSIFALNRTCREWNSVCSTWKKEKLLTNRIKKMLLQKGIDDNWLQAILESNCVITGSSLLRALQGGNWESKDIDIFSPYQNPKLLAFARDQEELEVTNVITYDISRFDVARFELNKSEIEVISPVSYIDEMDLEKFNPTEEFDFDFLKNSFDGKNLIIRCTDSLIHESSSIKVTERGTKDEKYAKKPICISHCADSFYSIFHTLYCKHSGKTRHIDRYKKYLERGYKIENVTMKSIEFKTYKIDFYYLNNEKWIPVLIRGPDDLENSVSVIDILEQQHHDYDRTYSTFHTYTNWVNEFAALLGDVDEKKKIKWVNVLRKESMGSAWAW